MHSQTNELLSSNKHQYRIKEQTITRLETLLHRKILRGGDTAINEALDMLERERK